MPNYQNSKIYIIKCNITNDVYYGSTTTTLDKRKYVHKNNSIKTSASSIIDRNDWVIELVEDYPCNNIYELLKRERYFIDNNKCVNICCPLRTDEEKNQKKREDKIKERKEPKYNQYQKEYYKTKGSCQYLCRCGAMVTHAKKSRHEQTKKHQTCVAE